MMRKRKNAVLFMLIFIFGFLESPLFAKIQNPEIDNLLKPLDAEIAKRDYYQNQKQIGNGFHLRQLQITIPSKRHKDV